MITSRYSFVLLLLLWASTGSAQQNIFNVPSSEITEPGKVFLQQQFNFYRQNSVSNTTFCYGIGHESEIGLNILGVTYDNATARLVSSQDGEEPVFPSLGLNAQKLIVISDVYDVSAGGQFLIPSQIREYEWYLYLNNRIHVDRLKLIVGAFTGNINYFDSERLFNGWDQRLGFQAGLEYEIVRDRLYLQSDFITGRTALSNLIVGGAYKVTQQLIISAGYQFPNNLATSSKGIILEITYVE